LWELFCYDFPRKLGKHGTFERKNHITKSRHWHSNFKVWHLFIQFDVWTLQRHVHVNFITCCFQHPTSKSTAKTFPYSTHFGTFHSCLEFRFPCLISVSDLDLFSYQGRYPRLTRPPRLFKIHVFCRCRGQISDEVNFGDVLRWYTSFVDVGVKLVLRLILDTGKRDRLRHYKSRRAKTRYSLIDVACRYIV